MVPHTAGRLVVQAEQSTMSTAAKHHHAEINDSLGSAPKTSHPHKYQYLDCRYISQTGDEPKGNLAGTVASIETARHYG